MKVVDVLKALIDTSERLTDLEGVYNDTTGQFFTWAQVRHAKEELEKMSELF